MSVSFSRIGQSFQRDVVTAEHRHHFLGPAALPFLPSPAMTNGYPLAGVWHLDSCWCFVPTSKDAQSENQACFWKEGAQGIVQKAVVISAEPMGHWQYPELHSGVLACLWNETQEFRLADLFREVSGGERIILKGWLGGEGWCFCGLDKVPRISCHAAKSKCPCDGMFAKWENSIAIRLLINSKHVLWRLVTHRLIQKIGNV